MFLSIFFLFIPSLASLSMRQATELTITLTLSLISFILLLLAVFLGATSIWKDIERRYTFSVLSLPISRTTYLIGKFLGVALFILLTALFLGVFAVIAIKSASYGYPPSRPLVWSTIVVAIVFDAFKYIIIAAVSILLSTVSSSFFLPIFGAISTYFAGTVTQEVYDYLHTPSAQTAVVGFVRKVALSLYYILPNLGSFNLKANAIYSIPINLLGITLTLCYFIVYVSIVISIAALLFNKKDMK
jgi:ABC-type transport system involved in multi-copper enzyme maturation permease subunit